MFTGTVRMAAPAKELPAWLRPGVIRHPLGGLLAVGALNAFAGGSYGFTGSGGLPTEWLDRGPFRDYFIPGLILFTLVGGCCLAAAIAVYGGFGSARWLAQLAAVVVFAFIAVEMAILGSPFWLQPFTAIAASLILALARQL